MLFGNFLHLSKNNFFPVEITFYRGCYTNSQKILSQKIGEDVRGTGDLWETTDFFHDVMSEAKEQKR